MQGKYTKMLEERQAQENANRSFTSSSEERLPKIEWFNANNAVKNSPDNTYYVRVLPIEGKDSWFYTFQKHSFRCGTWKNNLCARSKRSDGTVFGKCAICDFLDAHKEELAGSQGLKETRASDSSKIFIYDYNQKKIFQTELNFYGLNDVLKCIVKANEEDPTLEEYVDKEGFNLYYEKDENGWAKIVGVKRAKKSVADIKEILGIKKLPDVEAYVFQYPLRFHTKSLEGLLDLAINSNMFPEVDNAKRKPTATSSYLGEDDDITFPAEPFDIEEEVTEQPVEPKKTTAMVSDSELDDILEGID